MLRQMQNVKNDVIIIIIIKPYVDNVIIRKHLDMLSPLTNNDVMMKFCV